MKKILTFIITIICCIFSLFGLVACDNQENSPENSHIHTWKSSWSMDKTYHWKDCENCLEKDSKSIHNFNGNSCYCGYTKNDENNNENSSSEVVGTEGLQYFPLSDNTYAVGIGNACYLQTIVIPSSYNNKPVTTLIDNGFTSSTVETIELPTTIINLGNYTFENCENLKNITIPNNVTCIGNSLFAGCVNLNSITL